MVSKLAALRQRFHQELNRRVVWVVRQGKMCFPNFADAKSITSARIAEQLGTLLQLGHKTSEKLSPKQLGKSFNALLAGSFNKPLTCSLTCDQAGGSFSPRAPSCLSSSSIGIWKNCSR